MLATIGVTVSVLLIIRLEFIKFKRRWIQCRNVECVYNIHKWETERIPLL